MAQQLGVLDVLAEDPGLVPSTNVQCMAVCNSSSRGSIAFFWILRALHAHVTHTEYWRGTAEVATDTGKSLP